MNNIYKLIGQFKIYISRSGAYLSIFNTFVLFLTFKSIYKIPVPAWIIVLIGFFGINLLGYLDYKLIAKEQNKYSNNQNDVKHDLILIKKKLNIE